MIKHLFTGWRLRLIRPGGSTGWRRPNKRSAIAQLALGLFALLLTGCSHSPKDQQGRPQAWLEPGTRVTLPAPGITPAVNAQQLLTGRFNGKTQSSEASFIPLYTAD